jgi:transcription initiation factor IIE alpha subunit
MSIEKVDFQKVVKEQIPYTLVCTKVIQQIQDPLALAMWVYLLSLPPEWNINKAQLKNHFKIGDNRLKRTLSFLSKSKLIEYVRKRLR